MATAPGYSDEQVRALVYEYENLRQGSKQAWLDARGISRHKIRRWRIAVFDGDLDHGLIPREGGPMTPPHRRRKIARNHDQSETDNEQLRARIRELEATNEALGKAIGLLHQLNEQGPDSAETTVPPDS